MKPFPPLWLPALLTFLSIAFTVDSCKLALEHMQRKISQLTSFEPEILDMENKRLYQLLVELIATDESFHLCLEQIPAQSREPFYQSHSMSLKKLTTHLNKIYHIQIESISFEITCVSLETEQFLRVTTPALCALEKVSDYKELFKSDNIIKSNVASFRSGVLNKFFTKFQDLERLLPIIEQVYRKYSAVDGMNLLPAILDHKRQLDTVITRANDCIWKALSSLRESWARIGVGCDIFIRNEPVCNTKFETETVNADSRTIAIGFFNEKSAISVAEELAKAYYSVMVINSGPYVDFSGCIDKPVELSELNYDRVKLNSLFRTSSCIIGVLSTLSIPLALPESFKYVDSFAKSSEDGFILNMRGNEEMKRRIFLQFKTAILHNFDTIVIDARYGSGDIYANHPANVAAGYLRAIEAYQSSCLKQIVFVLENPGDLYASTVMKLLQKGCKVDFNY